MKAFFKYGLILVSLIIQSVSVNCQVTMSVNDLTPLGPLVIDDTTYFQVTIGVTDGASNPDSVSGDIYYWYLTDSMIASGQPPRQLDQDFNNELVIDGFVDTISIDIQPYEIRTSPVNLIIVWPAMIDSAVQDTQSTSIWVNGQENNGENSQTTGLMGYSVHGGHVYPSPAQQFLYIRKEELAHLYQIRIMSMEGNVVNEYLKESFISGFISMDNLENGYYFIELVYLGGGRSCTKILKY